MLVETKTKSLFIDGTWKDVDGKTETIYNPATLEPITEIDFAGKIEAEEAISAAQAAFESWSGLTGRERSRVLYKAHELMLDEAERLGEILTLEQGKPLTEAIGEVKGAAAFLLWYAEEASRGYGEWIPPSNSSKRSLVIPQPVGVVGAITPWNFPSSMITRKIAPAIAAGCTIVLKPAPETPLSAIEIIKILQEAGLPDGVVNLITGDSQAIGEALLESKDVQHITFTGSTAVGKYLMEKSANHVKRLSLELGGHAPSIVFEDADLEQAAKLVLESKFRNNGQTCICTNRLYVHESVQEEFTKILTEKVEQLQVGSGVEEGTQIGPLINKQASEKVSSHVEDAVNKGAEVLSGGSTWSGGFNGHFYEPTILSNVTDEMVIMNEETFGPVIPIQTFTEESDVIQKANDTDYGLASFIFTENTSRAIRISEKLAYGIVGINDVAPAAAETPFGGMKQSGLGKEGGHYGMSEFLEEKFVSIGIK